MGKCSCMNAFPFLSTLKDCLTPEVFSVYSLTSLIVQGEQEVLQGHGILLSAQIMVPGMQNNILLRTLIPDTEYKVTVTPIYTTGEGVSVSAPGRTCK